MTKTHALYAGSFDPITRGHLDIIRQAQQVFDLVTVSVGINPKKTRLFPVERSVALIKQSVMEAGIDPKRLSVSRFQSSIMHHAKEISATSVVRGLRQVSDFNDEFVLHGVLERNLDIPVVYLICRQEFLHVSSSTARELASLGENVDWLVTPTVEMALKRG